MNKPPQKKEEVQIFGRVKCNCDERWHKWIDEAPIEETITEDLGHSGLDKTDKDHYGLEIIFSGKDVVSIVQALRKLLKEN